MAGVICLLVKLRRCCASMGPDTRVGTSGIYRCSLGVFVLLIIAGCASTDELFAQYDADFCPAPATELVKVQHVVTEKEVFRDRVVVKEVEVPAAARKSLAWEPAIYFADDSAILTRVAKQSLRDNVSMLKSFPKYLVTVRGFTDQRSSAAYNIDLALERVGSVRDYLTGSGIGAERIIGEALGESVSLASGGSPVAGSINRRVELMLLDAQGRPLSSERHLIMGPTEQQ